MLPVDNATSQNECNKYELKRERQEKDIMQKELDSISYPFKREYFKVKNEKY